MSEPIRTRRLARPDETAWRALFADYVDFYRASVAEEVVALTWERIVGASPEFVGLGATTSDGRLIGFAIALMHRSTWSATCYCYLEDLYVAPEVRGQGAGQALIAAVYAAADAAGATRTYWVTEEDNAAARRLYDKLAVMVPFVQYRR